MLNRSANKDIAAQLRNCKVSWKDVFFALQQQYYHFDECPCNLASMVAKTSKQETLHSATAQSSHHALISFQVVIFRSPEKRFKHTSLVGFWNLAVSEMHLEKWRVTSCDIPARERVKCIWLTSFKPCNYNIQFYSLFGGQKLNTNLTDHWDLSRK